MDTVDIMEDNDRVFLTETHLNPTITDSDVYTSGFKMPVRNSRGVALTLRTMLVLIPFCYRLA